jgi:hypothetical protein
MTFYETRLAEWDKYYKPDTDDWGRDTKESPIRGVSICYRCGTLVEDTWKHLDWHTELQGEDWKR